MSYNNIIPVENATNAPKNMTTRGQITSSHIPRGLPRRQNYDTSKSYYTSTKNMTTWSHMPRRIGIFFARAGQRRT